MKISAKKLLCASMLASMAFVTVFAEEDEDVDDEMEIEDAEEELEVEQEPIDEVALAEQTTGIIDPANHPGRVISRKKILSKSPAAGQPMEVEYTIWNVGNTDVSDVEVTDESYTDEFFAEAVKVSFKADKIEAGSKYSEVHTVVPKEEGKIKLSGAKVSYKSVISADSTDSVVYQSEGASEGLVPISSAAHYARHVQSHVFDWLCFGLLAVPSTVLPYMAAQATLTRYSKAKSA